MGAMQNNESKKGSKNSGRGSTNNKKRLEAFGNSGSAGGADWGGCDPQALQDVVSQMTLLGGAIIFGMSRDGGAHLLTLLIDNEKETLWFNADADLDAELHQVSEKLKSMA